MDENDLSPIQLPINGTLDLHMFSPKDAASVVKEYIRSCLEKKIYEIRIIHGKGYGILRRKIHSLLKKNPMVDSFRQAPPEAGGWGATLVELKRK